MKTAVLTSATLAVGKRSFDFIKNRLGIDRAAERRLGSPFDYKRQAELILSRDMPDPSERPGEFENAVCDRIRRYVAQTRGRAFVLFTSYKMMNGCAQKLGSWFEENGYHLYRQSEGLPNSLMLERFRKDRGGRALRDRQFLAGSRRSGRRLEERDHYEAAVQRARSSAAGSAAGGDPRRGETRLSSTRFPRRSSS